MNWLQGQFRRATRKTREWANPPTQAVLVDELISPLRYDIMIRLSFFERFGGTKDVESILPTLLDDSYFVWFREVRVPRRWPAILDDPDALRRAFASQVGRALELYDRFHASGYDSSQPLRIRSAKHVLPTKSGKLVERVAFIGDGCHRLALLKLAGHVQLEPSMYRLETRSDFSPHDNTAILLPHLRLTPGAYYRFLSMGYGIPISDSKTELIDRVREAQPDRLTELLGVIGVDESLTSGWAET